MAGRQKPDQVAREMWDLYSEAQAANRRSASKSTEEQQTMQTMALTAMAAMQAEQATYED